MDEVEPAPEQLLKSLRDGLAAVKQQNANLRVALGSSRRVGMALGILMATYKITSEQSFEMLSQVSQASNRKVRDLAEHLILTGSLP